VNYNRLAFQAASWRPWIKKHPLEMLLVLQFIFLTGVIQKAFEKRLLKKLGA
jgi:hypothetical protein